MVTRQSKRIGKRFTVIEMRIFITGGTAFIGKHLHRRLIAEGHEVLAIQRKAPSDSALQTNDDAGLKFVTCDLLDYPTLDREIKTFQPDIVFHLASLRSTFNEDNAHLVLRTNAEATYRLAKACAALPAKPKLIFTSAMGCYNYEHPDYVPVDEAHPLQPVDDYGLSKLLGELACEFLSDRHQLPCVILRISGVFGPGKRAGLIYNCLEAARSGGSIKVAGGKVRRDFVYVDDVVQSLVLSMRAPIDDECRILNIGGGRGASLLEIIGMVERITGAKIKDRKSVV